MGGARMAPFFMLSAAANELISQYAISTWDSPTFMTGNPATVPQEGLPGSVGVGVAPGWDVETDQLAFPQPREQACVDILSNAGITFASRPEARTALLYCDAVFFLKAGLDKATTTSAAAFKEAVATLGEEYQTATVVRHLLRGRPLRRHVGLPRARLRHGLLLLHVRHGSRPASGRRDVTRPLDAHVAYAARVAMGVTGEQAGPLVRPGRRRPRPRAGHRDRAGLLRRAGRRRRRDPAGARPSPPTCRPRPARWPSS